MIAANHTKASKSKITYHWGDNNLLVVLSNNIHPRIKALFWAEFLVTIGMATIFVGQAIPFSGDLLHWGVAVGAATLYLLAGFRFISRMFFEEKIFLDTESITVVERTPFTQKLGRYKWNEMGPLHYIGKDEKTDHPLKGKCFDYLGFETREHLIQSLHQEGNFYFNHSGFPIRFAKGVYSWDAEEMVNMMKLFAGSKLRLGIEWARMLQEHEWDDV